MKVAIKLPDTIREIIQTFPLLHAINKILAKKWDESEIDDYEIHFICLNKSISVLNLLPFKAFYHEIENEDLKNVFSIHRAIKNSRLDFIDTFISTTKSFVDASIGKNLNAEVRGGFDFSKNKVFINKTCPYLEGQHKSNIYFSLINIIDSSIDNKPSNVGSRDLEPIYADYSDNPYYVINLPLDSEENFDSQWADFFDLFEGKTFVICSENLDSEIHDIKLQQIVERFNKKNTYKVFNPLDKIAFGKMISYSKAFITFDSDLLYIAAYCGATCFWMNDKQNAATEYPEYFYSDVRHFDLRQPLYKGSNSCYNFSPIFDEVFRFICDDKEAEDDHL